MISLASGAGQNLPILRQSADNSGPQKAAPVFASGGEFGRTGKRPRRQNRRRTGLPPVYLPIHAPRNGIGSGAQVPHGEQSLTIARRRLEADLGSRRLLVATVSVDHLRGARQLLIEHGRTEALRGPDALQLSVPWGVGRRGTKSNVKEDIAKNQ